MFQNSLARNAEFADGSFNNIALVPGKIVQDKILLQLIIDNLSVGQLLVSLHPGVQKTFLFNTALPETGIHRAMVELDADDRLLDNRYYFNLFIPDQRNITIISNTQEAYCL